MYIVDKNETTTSKCEFPDNTLEADDPLCKSKRTKINTEIVELAHQNPVIEKMLNWRTKLVGLFGDLLHVSPFIALFGLAIPLVMGYIYIVRLYVISIGFD